MKTVRKCLSGLPAVLALAMLVVSCTVDKTPEFELNGTWESTDTSLYSGWLVIKSDTITITGYAESQTPDPWKGGDDTKRPFRDFAKGAPLACRAEDGKLFIKTALGEKIVPYSYYSASGQGRFLYFNFGGREEALRRTGN
jgi:hypothetical protein